MATALHSSVANMRWAKSPFYFMAAANLIRIGREKATTLSELLEGLKNCPDSAIFQHTFQTLREHHFIREGFSNDFAHWAFAACNEIGLAERLAAVDVRDFTGVQALRDRIVQIVDEYLQVNPRARDRAAFEPFYFCSTDTVVIPTPYVARNVREFLEGLQRVSITSIHYHFIEARIRLKLNSNDFSMWLEEQLDMGSAADRLSRIDIYTSTLQDIRKEIIRAIERSIA